MSMNKFCFHAVGQGLFYTGSLFDGKFNFVYDCGTENSVRYVQNEIDAYVDSLPNGCKALDFVVISHMHRDHFSGLKYLLSKIRVRNLYLPYLGNNPAVIKVMLAEIFFGEMLGVEYFDDYSFASDLYLSPYRVNNLDNVRYFGENDDEYRQERERRKDETEIETTRSVTVEEKDDWRYVTELLQCFGLRKRGWTFVFVNKQISPAEQSKLDSLIPIDCDRCLENMILAEDLGGIKKIIDNYKEVFPKTFFNDMATVLLHFPDDRSALISSLCTKSLTHSGGAILSFIAQHSTLLTGDAMLDDVMLSILMSYFPYGYGVLQLPHHGSAKNYFGNNKKPLEFWRKFQFMIASFGLGNQYCHPNVSVVNHIHSLPAELLTCNQTQSVVYSILN